MIVQANFSKLCVIVPAYNEEKSIGRVIAKVCQVLPRAEIIVIDDGSQDKTAEIAKEHRVRVLRHPRNCGVGAAVRSGLRWALTHRYTAAAQVDADGQHDPFYLPRLMKPILNGYADVVIGSRSRQESKSHSASRFFGSRLLSLWLRVLCGQTVADTTSGYRLFNERAMRFLQTRYRGDLPEPESLVALLTAGFRVLEVPVCMKKRTAGKSSINLFKGIRIMLELPWAMLLRRVDEVKHRGQHHKA